MVVEVARLNSKWTSIQRKAARGKKIDWESVNEKKNTSGGHPTQNSSCIENTKTQHEWISIVQGIVNPD